MSLKDRLLEHLKQFHTAPFLFIGAGLSRRYLGLDDWTSLLQRMSLLTGRPYAYYRATGNGKLPAIATEIARDLHPKWWSDPVFDEARERYKDEAKNLQSAFKIEIARYVEQVSAEVTTDTELLAEVELLKGATIDGVITTNWDLFIETAFPDYRVFVGQEQLLFSAPLSVGEIYKIHGCCTEPNSLVVTSEDYARFNDRNPYLASKLLTIFVEHPIVFLGYSLNDENISNLLVSISSCLTTENIDQLRDRLIFVQRSKGAEGYSINDTSIVAGGYNIPVKVVATNDFASVFAAFGDIPRKFPAKLLRKLKQHVYNLVRDNDPDNHLYVADIDSEADLETLDVVFGVGSMEKDREAAKLIRISDDPDVPAVRLSKDESAPILPYRAPLALDAFADIQEQFVAAVRAWKTNQLSYVPRSELWDFYRARSTLDLERTGLECLLVSAMYQNCPFHYWARRLSKLEMGRERVFAVLQAEAVRDLYPGIRCAARLAFALGMSHGEAILAKIAKHSKYGSARDQAERLQQSMAKEKTVWSEYRTPIAGAVKFEGKLVSFNVNDIRKDADAIDSLITTLVDFGPKGRETVKRLDALFYGHL